MYIWFLYTYVIFLSFNSKCLFLKVLSMFIRFLFLFFLNACIPLYDVHLSTYISTCTLEKGNMCTLHHYYLLFSKKIIMYILYCFLTVFFHISIMLLFPLIMTTRTLLMITTEYQCRCCHTYNLQKMGDIVTSYSRYRRMKQ